MKAFIYINEDRIGEADLVITDESMGAVGAKLQASENYRRYRQAIQTHCEQKGISGMDDFSYRIVLADHTELKPEGGIGVTDVRGFDEIYIEAAGLDAATMAQFKTAR